MDFTADQLLASDHGDAEDRLPLLTLTEARAAVALLAYLEETHPAAVDLRARLVRRLPS